MKLERRRDDDAFRCGCQSGYRTGAAVARVIGDSAF